VTIRAIIVDDEPPSRARLRRLLIAQPDIEIVAECGDGASAVQDIESHAPDLVLLDIQMPELDGFDVLQALEMPRLPAIIFVSAFDQYALRAFRVHALDYVLKPVEPDRLSEALAHARDRLNEQRSAASVGLSSLLRDLMKDRLYLSRVPVRADRRVKVIDLADVDWLGAADNYVAMHVGSREFLVRDTIAGIEKRLDPQHFVRIHRSTIVRLDRIVELIADLHGDFQVLLKCGTMLAMSRTFRSHLEDRLGRRL
jgi:two-component system, LytTR family, response regulator